VDPAGVTIALSPERPVGVPFIDLGAGNTESQGFRSAVEVLLSMPAALIGQVDSITASTQDDVTMVLVSGQRVKWGDADDSAKKARVLVALIAAIADPNRAGTYDVSAPNNAVFSPDPVPPPPPTVETPPPVDGETQPEA
jgi:cell division protein FtsQ